MSFRWKGDSLLKNMAKLNDRGIAALTLYGDVAAKKLEASAKTNRPWEDRTGRARQSLKGYTAWVGNEKLKVILSHGVDYGVYLELCNEGKYSIIMPTINKEGPEIMEGLKQILK